jgi:hypothetical protein
MLAKLRHRARGSLRSVSSSDTMTKVSESTMGEVQLPFHLVSHDPSLTIHPLESQDGVIVKVQPTASPSDPNISHVPCDIVLVIDVSGSMEWRAPAPINDENGNASKEDFGLSVLDLTKHAARTVLETLNEGDRLGIVTFSATARVSNSGNTSLDIVANTIRCQGSSKAAANDRYEQEIGC